MTRSKIIQFCFSRDYPSCLIPGLSSLFLSSQTSCQRFWVRLWEWSTCLESHPLDFSMSICSKCSALISWNGTVLPLTHGWELSAVLPRWMSLPYKSLMPLCMRTRVDSGDRNPFSSNLCKYLGLREASRVSPPPLLRLALNSENWNLTKPIWVWGSIKPWERKDMICQWNWWEETCEAFVAS